MLLGVKLVTAIKEAMKDVAYRLHVRSRLQRLYRRALPGRRVRPRAGGLSSLIE